MVDQSRVSYDVQPPSELSSVTGPSIRDLFRTPTRFLRSVHLEYDFEDRVALEHYIVTPAMAAAFSRIVNGLRPASGHRAWRVTGDYGTGKSSFALGLAHLLRDPEAPSVAHIARVTSQDHGSGPPVEYPDRMLPILVTGDREPLVPAIARAIGHAIERLPPEGDRNQVRDHLSNRVAATAATASGQQLQHLLSDVDDYIAEHGLVGILLVLDELGKFLEYASQDPERNDIFVLQRLAEMAARSGARPLAIIGLLHQGFYAYAERLPSTIRTEWEKVAGRYEELAFDQPLAHVAALVAGALNIDTSEPPENITVAAHAAYSALHRIGWFYPLEEVSPLQLYPLHPTVLPVSVRFFAQYGQHERSLFSFLLSSEPLGLQAFAGRPATDTSWYRISDFYDYVRSAFGYRLAGTSYRTHWLRITEVLDRVSDVDSLQLSILKTVALINTIDAEHMQATDDLLVEAVADERSSDDVLASISELKQRGLLFDRGAAGGYRLWPGSSVNLNTLFQAAGRALGPIEQVVDHLEPFLDTQPVLARRHYIESGTLRHFELRIATSETLSTRVAAPTEADGLAVIVLCESSQDHDEAIDRVRAEEIATQPGIIVAVSAPLRSLTAELHDTRCWQWIVDNTPELAEDTYAAEEVARQLAASKHKLKTRLGMLFSSPIEDSETEWWHCGVRVVGGRTDRLSSVISNICDTLYNQAPLIQNELLNRRKLSSAATAARLRLIERVLTAADQPLLGMESDKAPPEKSMYLSILHAGRIHREVEGRSFLAEPPEEDDPLRLRPSMRRVMELVEEKEGDRVPVQAIFDSLKSRPFGIREGVAPLLLTIVLAAHMHELALYENGTFVQRITSAESLRLIKQPSAFELQLFRITGVRADVFSILGQVLVDNHLEHRDPDLLDIVRPLMIFAADLPEYTRNTAHLSVKAREVRDALLSAREPATLIFSDLPIACGHKPFTSRTATKSDGAEPYVTALQEALGDLRAAYPSLLQRISDQLTAQLATSDHIATRDQIARRASRAILAIHEPRLQGFVRSLADTQLPQDAWLERVGSYVAMKPPIRWTDLDEARSLDDMESLTATFTRVEATHFSHESIGQDVSTIRVALTHSDGDEEVTLVHCHKNDEPRIEALSRELETILSENDDLRLVALTRVLQRSLGRTDPSR